MAKKKKLSEKTDKRYRAKVVVGHDAEGRPVTKYASARAKKDLEAAKDELRKAYVTGQEERRKDTLFGPYVAAWYKTHKQPNLSHSSRQSYATILNAHLLPYLADKQLRAVTASDLQALLNSKAGCCVATISYMHSILTNVFRMAYSEGLIDRDPTVNLKKPAATKQSKRALTDAETEAALKVGREHPQGLILPLLYYTGMRLGEAVGLQWRDVDFKRRTISVRRDIDLKARCIGDVKTKYSVRDIPMPDALADILTPVRGVGEAFVFPALDGSFWGNSALFRLWIDLMRAVYEADNSIEYKTIEVRGENGKKIEAKASILTAHYFRHNYASVLYNAGVDILSAQRFLGHSSPKTTLEIYSHLSDAKEDINADKARAALEKGCQNESSGKKKNKKVAKRLPE